MHEYIVERVGWSAGTWTHEPVSVKHDNDDLLVAAVATSDAWRTTSYGFVHDTEHALLAPLASGQAVQVQFLCDYGEGQYDHAGIFLRADEQTWIKCGVEASDGTLMAGAVVTNPVSDWSLSPVPSWGGRRVTVRASRTGDAVTVRARVDAEPWILLRVAPFPEHVAVSAGPFCCAPVREGLTIRFYSWSVGDADASLH